MKAYLIAVIGGILFGQWVVGVVIAASHGFAGIYLGLSSMILFWGVVIFLEIRGLRN